MSRMAGGAVGCRAERWHCCPAVSWSLTLSRTACVCACVCVSHVTTASLGIWRPRSSRGTVTSTCSAGLGRGSSRVNTFQLFPQRRCSGEAAYAAFCDFLRGNCDFSFLIDISIYHCVREFFLPFFYFSKAC